MNAKSFKHLKLLTLEGKLVENYSYNDAQTDVQLALPNLSKGMYFIHIELENMPTVSLPFMVE